MASSKLNLIGVNSAELSSLPAALDRWLPLVKGSHVLVGRGRAGPEGQMTKYQRCEDGTDEGGRSLHAEFLFCQPMADHLDTDRIEERHHECHHDAGKYRRREDPEVGTSN